MTDIRPEIQRLIDRGNITLDEWRLMRAHHSEYLAMYPKLTDEAMGLAVKHNLANCARHPKIVYEGTLIEVLVPDLLRRIEQKNEALRAIQKIVDLELETHGEQSASRGLVRDLHAKIVAELRKVGLDL